MTFDTFDAAKLTDDLINRLKDEGFKFRNKKRGHNNYVYNRYIATHEERGVKAIITLHTQEHSKQVQIGFETRGLRNRYNSYQPPNTQYGDFCLHAFKNPANGTHPQDPELFLIRTLQTIAAMKGEPSTIAKLTNRDDLYPPLKFDAPVYEEDDKHKDRKIVRMKHVYALCRVKGIAVIGDNLKITLDGMYDPNQECWFYITGDSAKSESSASLDLIVAYSDDELVYYPVRHGKVTSDFTPVNTYINFKAFTELDRDLIEKAIAFYLRDLC